MRIGIDARSVGDKICGVSRYTICLLQAMATIKTEHEYIVYTYNIEKIEALSKQFTIKPTLCNRMNPINDLKFIKIVDKDNIDIFHVFHSWLSIVKPSKPKVIVTIHDIFSVTDPLFFIKRKPFHVILREYFKLLLNYSIRKADAVVTVSNYCKNEICKSFRIESNKISVIYNSAGITAKPIKKHQSSFKPYFFYLGNFRSYKNVEALISGYAQYFKNEENPVRLVLAGNDKSETILNLIRVLEIEAYVDFYHKPTDEKIIELYSNAVAFVFPSKYEGFGIPIIEAMSLGVPTVISDANALVEISNGCSLVFDKTKPSELAIKLKEISSNENLRNLLIESGIKNALNYTWENSAQKLLKLYNDL
ncbi:MAG: glycosyltransferase family 4 protein [Ruminiclostridium sp.]